MMTLFAFLYFLSPQIDMMKTEAGRGDCRWKNMALDASEQIKTEEEGGSDALLSVTGVDSARPLTPRAAAALTFCSTFT